MGGSGRQRETNFGSGNGTGNGTNLLFGSPFLFQVDLFDKTVGNLGSQLIKLNHVVCGLEERAFVPSERDFRNIWKCKGWPKRLTEARDKCMKSAPGHRERFEEELEQQQKMFFAELR